MKAETFGAGAESEPVHAGASLAARPDLSVIVTAFNASANAVRVAFAMLREAELSANAVIPVRGHGRIWIKPDGDHRSCDWSKPEAAIEEMRRATWHAIIARLELRRLLSVERLKKLEEQIDQPGRTWKSTERLPEITDENVAAFFAQYVTAIPEMFAEKVRAVFERLRPRGHTKVARLKTNTELEVPRKVILGGVVESSVQGKLRIRYESRAELQELEGIFRHLDGKGDTTAGNQSEIETAIETADDVITTYFRAVAHRNGHLHLWFLRDDLRAKFNAIAGGMRLRPGKVA